MSPGQRTFEYVQQAFLNVDTSFRKPFSDNRNDNNRNSSFSRDRQNSTPLSNRRDYSTGSTSDSNNNAQKRQKLDENQKQPEKPWTLPVNELLSKDRIFLKDLLQRRAMRKTTIVNERRKAQVESM